ncbi:MAG: WD40/YVTN/BNR-like repeat-containing protein [Terriglobales bacterium]
MLHPHLPRSLRVPLFTLALSLAAGGVLLAQGRRHAPPPKPPVNASSNPLLRPFVFRSIGPATMLGRVDDIEGTAQDPMLLYVGFATGGLWRSTDGGLHWTPLWNSLPNESVGAIAVAPSDKNIVYVGSGEANNRQSSSIGDGMWGTRDGGQTWKYLGLRNTQSIGGIAVDPRNPDVVYVAANGHLFGPNAERGLYKTTDGGQTWVKSKYIDENTGFEDVELDPSNPDVVYATSYEHQRTWWGYDGGGANSGLWKSTDAGSTWKRLDGPGWPQPKDDLYGRIAVAIFPPNPKIIYAQVEAGASAGVGGGTDVNGGPAKPRTGPGAFGPRKPAPPNPNGDGVYRTEDGGATWTLMSNQDQRPMYFSRIRVDPKNVDKILVGGTPGQISMDGGKTWKPMTGSHTDYHAIWINPTDPRIVLVGHDGGFDISHDGGKSWFYNNNMAVGQFYQVSADMRHPYYVCGGLQDNNAWCGPSAMRNSTGPVDTDWYTVAGGDGFYTRQDPADYNIVYGESQDGNMSRHDLRNGTQISVRPRFNSPATPGSFFPGGPGNIVNQPQDPPQLRYYWNAPFEISPFDPNKIYMAAQYFFVSTNRGDTWTMNPEDLSKDVSRWSASNNIMGVADNLPMVEKNDGLSASSLATQVRELPSQPGEIWVGTDDGNLQLSLDGGRHFTNVMDNLTSSVPSAPKGYVLVSRIEPSHFSGAVTYVALDNHRNDDYHPYLYKTTDYGKTWTDVTANLPALGEIQALREDSRNPNLLFVGTEFGLFISTNGGQSWEKFMTGLPEVPVNDILIHPRQRDLILATHGRSIWICDDITPLEQLPQIGDADVHLFNPRPAVEWKSDTEAQRHVYQNQFHGQNPQGGTAISIWAKNDMGPATIDFLQNNKVVSTMHEKDVPAGLNRFQWNMRGLAPKLTPQQAARMRQFRRFRRGASAGVPFVAEGGGGFFGRATGQGPLLAPGSYMVRVTVGGQTLKSSVVILADEWMHQEN